MTGHVATSRRESARCPRRTLPRGSRLRDSVVRAAAAPPRPRALRARPQLAFAIVRVYLSILPSQTRQQGARRASVPPCEQSMRTFRTSIVLLACSLSAVLAGTNAFGKKFLEENTARAGVTTLPSGLQYKVLRDGDGVPRQPTAVSLRGARGSPHPSPNTAQVRDTRCPTRAANATTRAARRRSGARHPRGRSSTARTTAAARPRLRRAASWQAGRRRCS